jgi:hypothetical protein
MATDEQFPSEPRPRGLSRRQMIKASAAAGAAAWAAPVIVDSLASPAAAASFPPCPDTGFWYVALHSPTSNGGLQERPGATWDASYSAPSLYGGGSCSVASPGPSCAPTSGYTRTTALAIRLTTTNQNISHNVQNQNTGSVTLTLDPTSCCKITRVVAQVHRFGTPTPPNDCPSDYCQTASVGNTYLPISGGALGTKSLTLNPSRQNGLCNGQGIHWGSPNNVSVCNTQPNGNGYSNGQPFGYLMIEVHCDPSFVGR